MGLIQGVVLSTLTDNKEDMDQINVIDGRLELTTDVPNVSIRTILYFTRKNMPRRVVLDLTLDACDLLNFISKNKIVALYMKNFRKYLNVMPKCPLKKDFNYTLTGYKLEIPLYIPEGDAKTIHQIIYENKLSGQIVVFGRVVHV
ncbi:uncharacterized protein LOC142225180 [Haematobia irritans]|uniref:uncharacterized protein LOC142225180 n=1 Tax=Haematobia irritans TaxID=7368 RepID=UPI003F5084D4